MVSPSKEKTADPSSALNGGDDSKPATSQAIEPLPKELDDIIEAAFKRSYEGNKPSESTEKWMETLPEKERDALNECIDAIIQGALVTAAQRSYETLLLRKQANEVIKQQLTKKPSISKSKTIAPSNKHAGGDKRRWPRDSAQYRSSSSNAPAPHGRQGPPHPPPPFDNHYYRQPPPYGFRGGGPPTPYDDRPPYNDDRYQPHNGPPPPVGRYRDDDYYARRSPPRDDDYYARRRGDSYDRRHDDYHDDRGRWRARSPERYRSQERHRHSRSYDGSPITDRHARYRRSPTPDREERRRRRHAADDADKTLPNVNGEPKFEEKPVKEAYILAGEESLTMKENSSPTTRSRKSKRKSDRKKHRSRRSRSRSGSSERHHRRRKHRSKDSDSDRSYDRTPSPRHSRSSRRRHHRNRSHTPSDDETPRSSERKRKSRSSSRKKRKRDKDRDKEPRSPDAKVKDSAVKD